MRAGACVYRAEVHIHHVHRLVELRVACVCASVRVGACARTLWSVTIHEVLDIARRWLSVQHTERHQVGRRKPLPHHALEAQHFSDIMKHILVIS